MSGLLRDAQNGRVLGDIIIEKDDPFDHFLSISVRYGGDMIPRQRANRVGPHIVDRNTALWDEGELQRWRLTEEQQGKELKEEGEDDDDDDAWERRSAVLADDKKAFVLKK